VLYKKSKIFLLLYFLSSTAMCLADTKKVSRQSFYVGAIGGYGATTWQGLVPAKANQNPALRLSTPIVVEEGGVAWGLLAGYEFTRFFAIELSYQHYADATVHFDPMSLFSYFHDGLEILTTQTETLNLIGKLMVPIPHSNMKIFSGAGVAGVHRKDIVVNDWRQGPTFTVGVNYDFTEHIVGEVAGTFTTGYGESQLSPVDTYYPFLYSIAAHLIYRF
jgi:hypothetical protein